MMFTIPIDFEVDETTELRAEREVFDFLVKATKEFGNEHNITDWYYTDFGSATEKSSGAGRGIDNLGQGKSLQSAQQTCNNTIKAGECTRCCYCCRSIP